MVVLLLAVVVVVALAPPAVLVVTVVLGFDAALVLGLPAPGLGAVAAAADLGTVAEAGLAEDLGAAVSEEVVVVPRRKEEAEEVA